MPASQLKRLKASLREEGITGPQKSKKQKKAGQNGKNTDQRIQRSAALQHIRDSFNPFELQAPSRPEKFESVSRKSANVKKYKEVLHRPGVTKSAGEEMRRRNLLPEMQRRNKVGGLVDRRIGEDDPGMTAEEKAVQRFAREKKGKGASLFDLEGSDDDEPRIDLTHMGKSLDDFDDVNLGDTGSASSDDEDLLRRKRRRSRDDAEVDEVEQAADNEPERKKTKKEVMEEVIAKSKMHKYERQKAKEDDDDLREDLDEGMSEMLALLQGHKPPSSKPAEKESTGTNKSDGPVINADRQKLLDGMDRATADKEYEVRLRQMAQDTRAKPSERTKTEEEKSEEQAEKLRKLEERREKRMQGEQVSDGEEDVKAAARDDNSDDNEDIVDGESMHDEAAEFGFTSSTLQQKPKPKPQNPVFEDEDDFAFEEDLVASGSDMELSENSEHSDSESDAEDMAAANAEQEEEDEFVKGILGTSANVTAISTDKPANGISYNYPCPRSHAEFLDVIKDTPVEGVPTMVQRIRALHHSSLSAANKESMAEFCTALVDHISYMGVAKQPLPVSEQLIRHLHSLSRTYPEKIADTFRQHLLTFHERSQPTAGDLIILTAIGSIYPTSDHFHQVVTPAITLMARWLALNSPTTEKNASTGEFLVALCLDYQKLSKRYIPEAVLFSLKALSVKPTPTPAQLRPHLDNLAVMADLWKNKSAFPEIFAPFLALLPTLKVARKEHQLLQLLTQQSLLVRRPLQLHSHRPQPIRTSIPKFEEGYNPDKHYDPDKERSDAKKLQAEYKREKKGAVRELRKDASFMAREMLREKRVRDEEYERKQRRIIAEIQGEEGKEAKEYQREKRRAGRK